ncbi:CatB-related O-acetyltransferase [Microbulbifer sp. THAF38]|uniref:CatB-related O-acetyltransferase n=1 Tax=Microbulbifer sp. THAF38 TaxID=2587856 RepID=UPI001268F1D0|nr:CatB-related O-acetyltransferase [Microbulbifer sp. THAF38]QFT53812.1 Streptogramin A acetyltransferase [Microbulbifer sp. THAF38]
MLLSNPLIFDKLYCFLAELPIISSSFSTSISLNDCQNINVKKTKSLSNTYFEESVRLNSSVLLGQYKTFIGAHSYVGEGGYLKQSFIGRYCSIGRRVTIGAGSHEMTNLTTYPGLSKKNPTNPVILENDVWVGDGVVILPGVRVQTGAVIGANSVVTKDVEAFSVIAGAPARHIRYRIDPSLFDFIKTSNWWEYPKDILSETKNLELIDRLHVLKAFPKEKYKKYGTYSLI